jgi:four helix bundle protein
MIAQHYRDLICWQLSVQRCDETIAITDRPRFARNFKLCEQVGQSTRSAAANIAEAFGRSDSEFRRFLDIALGSLKETENHLDEALQRRYLTSEEHEHLRRLAKRAHQAALRLSQYLLRCIVEKSKRRSSKRPEGPVRPERPV